MFKVNNQDTRTKPMTSFKYLFNYEHISQLFLVFLLLTLSMYLSAGNLLQLLTGVGIPHFLKSRFKKLFYNIHK